jgi:hypothetical protein
VRGHDERRLEGGDRRQWTPDESRRQARGGRLAEDGDGFAGRYGSLGEVEGESTQDDLRLQSGLLVELQDSVEVAGIGLARMKEQRYARK